MKGKSKTLLKTIISALALLMASVGLFNLFSRKEQVYAAVTIASEEYTSKDTNNIIMSVEKVAVAKDYTSKITDDEIKSFLAPNNKTYYYADIANGDKSKTVVENNKYIMLNNNATENNHYYNSYITNIREGQTIIKMSEAIMFTFGTYVYEKDDLGEHVYRNSEDKSSQLQSLNLEVYKGGHRGDAGAEKMPSEDFSTRQYQIGDKFYHDFVYILEQADVGESTKYTEGYYEFFVEYQLFGGDTETQTFGFYLIYESSYTNVYTPAGKSYFYTARPTLSVYGGGLTSDGSNVNHFRLGDSTNYPTLIYDYTKYVVGYTYTANGKRSTYNYTYTTKQNMGYTENHLICDVTSSGEKLEPVDYLLKSDNNMAVIMLTEVGTYNFTFSYIYTGDLKDEAPDITESLKIDGTSLQIHGFESKYSKDGYNEAQLRYVTLSTDENDNIDLVVPNGYVKDSTPLTEDLQIVYSTNSSSSARVGNVIAQEDALVNAQITKNVAQTLDDTTLKTLDDVVAGLKSDDATAFNTAKAEICLDKIDYVKTNQNSVWFSTNDAFDDESYYFYDRTDPNNFTSGNGRKEYGNTVSFVNPGYYLVLIKVKLGYVADGGAVQDYYQVFAFEITSKTIVAKLTKESTGEAIGSGKYTNDNVIVTWEEPATFERQISARYYTNTQPTPVIIANGKVLGEEVKTGEYSKYTIEIKSEGEASTTHTVTIDRQPISNVGLYEIETISADTSRFYMVRQTEGGGYAKVSGLISDSAVTLYWNNKLSGAGITAKYWRWDFTENKSADVFNIYGSAESTESWFSNKYQLSSAEPGVISGISKANSLDSEVAPAYVYRENGVYLFELTDDAGNSCYYMFVVDSTPAYLKVGNEFVNAQAKLFTTGVDVEASTHKAIKMFDETELEETASQLVERIKNSTSGKEILSSFIKLASFSTNQTENFKEAGFFYTNQSDATEIERMQKLFSRQQNNAYLVVKNMYMYAYDSEQHEDTSLYMNIQTASSRIKHINEVANGHSTSTVRNLYIVGENQLHVGQTLGAADVRRSKSYAVVEINSDNSKGMVYYSGDPITQSIIEGATDLEHPTGKASRLYTGNDIQGAHATDANYVAFIWTVGTGPFEIESITYDYYALNTASFIDADVVVGNEGTYYYTNHVGNYVIYQSNYATPTDGGWFNDNTQGYAIINRKNNKTQPGLYVVTRKYAHAEGQDGECKYYFIVDRNGIVSSTGANFAKNINISMLGGKDACNDFESVGYTTAKFSYDNPQTGIREENNVQYTIYLNTSKLPAQINIPVGKYFNYDNTGRAQYSNYYAGKLQFTVYFVDTYNQLVSVSGETKTTLKLFSVDLDKTQRIGGYYVLDLSQMDYKFRSFFLHQDNEKDWLCLPGDYIVAISDNVENASVARAKEYIGFRIVEALNPQVEVLAALKEIKDGEEDISHYETVSSNNNFKVVTSAEAVKFTLPAFDDSNDYAQVDENYLIVEEHYNSDAITRMFINHPYRYISGEKMDGTSSYVKINEDGSRTIYLDTKLIRDAEGNVDVSKLNIPLYYTIKIRYILSSSASSDEFANCYYHYVDGESVPYYESVYTVMIDRVAPENNIKYLEDHDALARYYYEDGKTSLFAQAVTENNSGLYFSNMYINRDLQNLYAMAVTEETPFNKEGISALYYIAYDSVIGLHWSPSQLPEGELVELKDIDKENITFGDLGLPSSKYIEILELDEAGNTTQYLIYYCATDDVNPYFDVRLTLGAQQYKRYITADDKEEGAWDEDNTELTFDIAEEGKHFTIHSVGINYNIDGQSHLASIENGKHNEIYYYFALLDLKTSQIKFAYTTNAKTDFDGLDVPTAVVNGINNAGPGNYQFIIKTQDASKIYSAIIDYYSSDEYKIDAKDLVTEDKSAILLNHANKEISGIMYYARKIEIIVDGEKTTYECRPEEGYAYYVGDVKADNEIRTNRTSTYQIITEDVFGGKSVHRFRADGEEFIKFESTGNYFKSGTEYYAFDESTLTFDTSVYSIKVSYSFNNLSYELPVDDTAEPVVGYKGLITYYKNNGTIILKPYKELSAGAIFKASVEFYYKDNDKADETYTIIIDSNTENVVLMDSKIETHEMKFNYNVGPNFYDIITDFGVPASGRMTLSWTRMQNNYYTYKYWLHEILNDGSPKQPIELEGNTYNIETLSSSSGKYYFEIEVRSNPEKTDGTSIYIGNKVYAFAVAPLPSKLYSIIDADGKTLEMNSEFNRDDIKNLISKSDYDALKEGYPYDLYISNNAMTIVLTPTVEGLKKEIFISRDLGDGYKLEIYLIYTEAGTLHEYVGLLQAPKTETLISSSLTYDDKPWEVLENLEELYVTNKDVNLRFTPKLTLDAGTTTIKLKNSILVDVYYNGQHIGPDDYQFDIKDGGVYTLSGNEYTYKIRGSGEYEFRFTDLAGNKHVFHPLYDALSSSERISLTVLREIVVTVENDGKVTSPINYAYYNGEVKVAVYKGEKYGSNIVNLNVTRNSSTYTPSKTGYVYNFTKPGTYVLNFKVNYEGTELRKRLVFTIINPKECLENINLSQIDTRANESWTITQVTKLDGADVTEAFLKMLENSNKLLTYDMVIAHSDELGLSAGKQYFKIDYKIVHGTYPERSASFAFSMNNEIPNITCSMAPGETTTKGFTISYNAGIIYDQIGECMIYVNDTCYIIDENSADGISTIEVTQKADGTGDYYVSLQTSSGNVISSFKVIIKEPLNFWAIVIIVVAVAAVSAVVITIIVLRNKMKIR